MRAAVFQPDGPKRPVLDERTWNAFIGVTTAIVGNVLISFALNLQRYAHIRLHREQLQQSQTWSKQAQRHKRPGYGAIAEQNGRNLSRDASTTESQALLSDVTSHPGRPARIDSERSQRREDTGFDEEQKSYLTSPYWWAGIILMVIGESGNFLAYGFAPASIVSPLGVVALISNCVIAPCLLHERFRQRDFLGVLVSIAGAVTIVLSVDSNEKKMGPHEIWRALTRWEFELYLGLTAMAIIVLVWASPRYGHKTILIDLGLVGLFGEYTALSTKGVASLLSDTLWRVITFPVTYLLVFVLISTALMQIRYINRALQRFPSTQVIPTQFVLFTLSVITGSAVLYRDFESTSAERVGKFVGGCALTFLGVYLITHGRPPAQDDEEADGLPAEDGISLLDEDSSRDAANGAELHRNASQEAPTKVASRQDSYASTRSRLSIPGIAISSTPVFGRAVSDNSLLNGPWQPTADDLAPQLAIERHRSYDAGEETFSSSVTDPMSPLEHYPDTPTRSSVARRSMSRLFPNPLVTPLSSSLNAVVAQSLRQGVDTPTRRMAAGLRSGSTTALPRAESLSTDNNAAPDVMNPLPETSPELPTAGPIALHRAERFNEPATDDGPNSHKNGGAKGVSETVRDLLHSKRSKGRSKKKKSGT